MVRQLGLLCCVLLLSSLVGCGDSTPRIVPVTGVVTLNGRPLPSATVRFVPQADSVGALIATAQSDSQGKFVLQCNGEPGACVANYKVTVSEGELPKELLPENKQAEMAAYIDGLKNRPIPGKFGSLLSTPLTATVSEDNTDIKLELKR